MPSNKTTMKMPEFFVFAKFLAIGVGSAEVWRLAFSLGTNFAPILIDFSPWINIGWMLGVTMLCLAYASERGAFSVVKKIVSSFRLDLALAVLVGIWINLLISTWLAKLHAKFAAIDPYWAPALLLLLCAMLASPLVQQYFSRIRKPSPQLYFIADEEITDLSEDVLASEMQAKSFAETVLASGAHSGLVFGVDGPWGIGKTSFINLAERYWLSNKDKVIVCRFEPLRYASEPDLAERLIRDLSATIQKQVFAPEFQSAASRYSRLIKGKADISFLGFKLTLEPSQETVDDLLDDIDEVLRRIGRRVIVVIDDLDRLDAKTANNVLFATRRTFKLSQATYVVCYDTEILAKGKDEDSKAREFLEKFVTIKLSLFVDSSSIRDFLRRDWQSAENNLVAIPSDTMLKLGAVLNELADILDGNAAAKYLPLLGNLRKVKRFVNAMLLMQLDKSNLGRTDFNKRDLINLLLLHLNYPGLFRQIYAEETEGRSGIFSVHHKYGESEFRNSDEFPTLVKDLEDVPKFLLAQLFDVSVLELGEREGIEEQVLASRACFNQGSARNLEAYLKLIVRFATPEPQETFVLYQGAVERVRAGESIPSVLMAPEFQLTHGEYAQDQFWRVLVNRSHDLPFSVADHAIDTLVENLPRYPMIANDDRGLRQRSIYSLLRLLDRAGWGRTSGRRRANTPENIVEIAWRIFGERSYEGRGLIQRLASEDRGVLGWSDLMLFRLQCSADRQGQLYNLHSALIIDQDENAATSGLVNNLALIGMRRISQEVFSFFKREYIESGRNFLLEVNNTLSESFFGEVPSQVVLDAQRNGASGQGFNNPTYYVDAERSLVKTFVIYQLSNSRPPNGSGVGCGYYDEVGDADNADIAKQMNDYMFGLCFNPAVDDANIFLFLDYCLAHLSNSFFSGSDEEGYSASRTDLPGGLDPIDMGRYWLHHRQTIRQRLIGVEERFVVTLNYIASYRDDLAGVFTVLDELAEEALAVEAQ